ncbi:TPA: fimbrial protein [Haemophilus influenzae]|uniref:fimbrial protein n=2 Tax=Haemophilus influenzae TaxID=727 RepID=UPI0006826AB5|nr:fimbrial protein [Haemophilus influenzae]KMZ22848.1 fimbrial protein [Haemophilus influenzae]MCK9032700.1 type 1 fimbrial protein [Haemophilus influenzae]RFO34613.1 type 1 fimbrial protein [Haemophilus influenzae]
MEQFIMKKTLLGSLILLAFAGNVQATVNDKTSGKVTFFGKVVENTCEVKTDYKNLSVVLNDVGKNSLSTTGNTAMPTPFTISLQNCNNVTSTANKVSKVGVYFYSWENADKDNNYTLKNKTTGGADFATMVNIQLMESDGTTPIKVIGKTTEDFVHKNTNGAVNSTAVTSKHISGSTVLNGNTSIDLHFISQYYATGMATAGKVESSVNFQIAYE